MKYILSVSIALASILSYAQLTIEDAVTGQFTKYAPQTMKQLDWFPGGDQYHYEKDNAIISNNVKGKEFTILTLDKLNTWAGTSFKNLPELKWTGPQQFYFINEGQYYHGDLKTQTIVSAVKAPSDAQTPDYHPASTSLAFTRDNNLFILRGAGKEMQVTNNNRGIVSGQIVSRNEYGIDKGTFWSPDGSMLAFYQKDENAVTDYPLTNYKEIPAAVKNIKYPMAGKASELISVGVFNPATGKTIFLKINDVFNDQYYATNLAWTPDNKTILVAWLNRATNEMRLKSFDASTGTEIKTLFTEKDNRWLEPMLPASFVPNHPDRFLWFSERNGFNNLYLYSTDGRLIGNTTATFELTEIVAYDPAGENVFVMGTGNNPTEMRCYRVNLTDMSLSLVTPASGTHRVKISGSGKYVLDTYSSTTVPNNVILADNAGRMIREILVAPDPMASVKIGQTEIFTIKADDNVDLYCRMIKPGNFDARKKYPVVVYVYSGPHVQLVQNSWLAAAPLWMHYLAQEGYLVLTIDGRGSEHRGKDFEQAIYREFGKKEMADQMSGVKWLKQQSYVDINRMAIHGWSYGGFMTTSMMLHNPGVFKVGVAGGAVIDWRLYEVMYTERYMDTPDENPDGYKKTDLSGFVKNLQGKLLMIHGTDDDVVVMQHAMKFLKACVDNNVEVDFFAYPGHPHNVRGKDRVHLMTKVIEYIQENL